MWRSIKSLPGLETVGHMSECEVWLVEMGFLEPGGRAGCIEKRMNERRQPVYGDCPLGKPRQQVSQFHYLLPCLLSGLSIGQGHMAVCRIVMLVSG